MRGNKTQIMKIFGKIRKKSKIQNFKNRHFRFLTFSILKFEIFDFVIKKFLGRLSPDFLFTSKKCFFSELVFFWGTPLRCKKNQIFRFMRFSVCSDHSNPSKSSKSVELKKIPFSAQKCQDPEPIHRMHSNTYSTLDDS